MQRFDENGNFVNLPEPEEIDVESDSFFTSNTDVIYDFVENQTSINEKNESKPES